MPKFKLKKGSRNWAPRKLKKRIIQTYHVESDGEITITATDGNRKIINTLIFNLPPIVTCPGATTDCKKVCYANKPYLRSTTVGAGKTRHRNLINTKSILFIDAMDFLIKSVGLSRMRIHEAGDFYNQTYLNKWLEIIKRNPDVQFWAYTKSHMLDFNDLPENLILRYSCDESTINIPLIDLPRAYMGIEKGFTCQGVTRPDEVNCGPCKLCFATKIPVNFPIH